MRSMGIAVAALLAALLCASESWAQWYVSVNGSAFSPSDFEAVEDYPATATRQRLTDIEVDMNAGIMASGTVGRSMEAFRVEGEIFYGKSDYDVSLMAETDGRIEVSEDFRLWGALVSAWYEFSVESGLKPYIGGGLGFYRSETKSSVEEAVNDGAVWRVGAGVVFDVGEAVSIDAGYRFMRGFSKLKDDVQGFSYNKPLELHGFMLGLRYNL